MWEAVPRIVEYVRADGIRCFEVNVWGGPECPNFRLLVELLRAPMMCYWWARYEETESPKCASAGVRKLSTEWMRLDKSTIRELARVVKDGLGPSLWPTTLIIVGTCVEWGTAGAPWDVGLAALVEFLCGGAQSGGVQCVLYCYAGEPEQVVYVRASAWCNLNRVIGRCNIDDKGVRVRRAYRYLRLGQLEVYLGLR